MPLTYWIQQQAKFPFLAPVAQDRLSAPASHAYVVCGDLTAGKRNRLTKHLQMPVFVKINLNHYGYR